MVRLHTRTSAERASARVAHRSAVSKARTGGRESRAHLDRLRAGRALQASVEIGMRGLPRIGGRSRGAHHANNERRSYRRRTPRREGPLCSMAEHHRADRKAMSRGRAPPSRTYRARAGKVIVRRFESAPHRARDPDSVLPGGLRTLPRITTWVARVVGPRSLSGRP